MALIIPAIFIFENSFFSDIILGGDNKARIFNELLENKSYEELDKGKKDYCALNPLTRRHALLFIYNEERKLQFQVPQPDALRIEEIEKKMIKLLQPTGKSLISNSNVFTATLLPQINTPKNFSQQNFTSSIANTVKKSLAQTSSLFQSVQPVSNVYLT